VAAKRQPPGSFQDSTTAPVRAGPVAGWPRLTQASLWALAGLHIALGIYSALLAAVALFAIRQPERVYTLFGLVEVPPGWPDSLDMAAYATICICAGIALAWRSRYGWWLAMGLWIERIPNVMRTLGTAEYSAWLLAALSLPVFLWLLAVRRYCPPRDRPKVMPL